MNKPDVPQRPTSLHIAKLFLFWRRTRSEYTHMDLVNYFCKEMHTVCNIYSYMNKQLV